LERTLGVPLFQEQVMAMAVAVGGFTAGQADALRRAMSTWKKRGALEEAGRELVRGMIEQGIEPPFAEAVYQQILGFGEYGFPESHAASFARLVYVSGWLKCHHHAAFLASLLNSQPMGFYSVRALLEDGRRHGVEVRPVCVQQSVWDASLETTSEGSPGIRLGLRQVRGMGQGAADHLVACRLSGAFEDVPDLAARTQLPRGVLEALSNAGALHALGLSRRSSHWLVQGLSDKQPLFGRWTPQEPSPCLKEESELESLWEDLKAVGWSVRGHPLEGFRDDLTQRGCVAIGSLVSMPSGSMVSVAGLVSSRQRPSTANGVVFMTLEDETGMLNVVIWPTVWDRFRRLARTHSALCVEGKLHREGLALSLVSRSFHPISLQNQAGHEVGQLPISSHDFH
jgi:error-prone DNA polymerase